MTDLEENTMDKLQTLFSAVPYDAVLVTTPINRRYFTGFASSAGTLLVTKEKSYFIIDSRYFEAAKKTINNCEVILQGDTMAQIKEKLEAHKVKSLGLESDTTLAEMAKYRKAFVGIALSENSDVTDAIFAQRHIKSQEEIACIQQAQDISDDTFTHILGYIAPGKTEREIALEMEFYSRKKGSEKVAFEFIVVSGENSSLPHGVPSDKPVEAGDFITMDFGSTINGYRSDMTRTVAVGHVSDEQRRVYETVLEAQLRSMELIKAGAVCNEVDKVARDIIGSAQGGIYKDCFGHGLGHGLGLDVHESPRFNQTCETVLEPGMVMSVEPGIYLPGRFGVRIEDIVAVTHGGYHNFAKSSKELVVL